MAGATWKQTISIAVVAKYSVGSHHEVSPNPHESIFMRIYICKAFALMHCISFDHFNFFDLMRRYFQIPMPHIMSGYIFSHGPYK